MKARISDIFASMQGEGTYLGEDQCFVRFYECGLKCDFCDTKPTTFKEYGLDSVLDTIQQEIGAKKINTVAVTGGEPLLQRDFLLEFLPQLKKRGLRSYLETNGVLFNELFDVIDYVDVIAMDIKLPSSTKQKEYWYEHDEFLMVAKAKEVFVKVVVCLDTKLDDFKRAVRLVKEVDPKIPFIIQPNSAHLGRGLVDKLQEFKKYSKQHLSDVRVIPQLHKVVGVK